VAVWQALAFRQHWRSLDNNLWGGLGHWQSKDERASSSPALHMEETGQKTNVEANMSKKEMWRIGLVDWKQRARNTCHLMQAQHDKYVHLKSELADHRSVHNCHYFFLLSKRLCSRYYYYYSYYIVHLYSPSNNKTVSNALYAYSNGTGMFLRHVWTMWWKLSSARCKEESSSSKGRHAKMHVGHSTWYIVVLVPLKFIRTLRSPVAEFSFVLNAEKTCM